MSDLFLKVEPISIGSETRDECMRLQMLAALSVACPPIENFTECAGKYWLLTRALPGVDLTAQAGCAPQIVVSVMAGALRALHSLPSELCPFDGRIDGRLAAARRLVEAGLVDESDFAPKNQGLSAAEVLRQLETTKPFFRDRPVITHGDACPPNFIAEGDRFSGFVDCGRAGVADRYADLALACRSIEDDCGPGWSERFLELYGERYVDEERLRYFELLDELF